MFTVVDQAGITYKATLNWPGTTQASVAFAYRTFGDRNDGNRYIERYLKTDSIRVDPSQATVIYQVKPDGTVLEFSKCAYNEIFKVTTMLFQTTNQTRGTHVLLAKIGDAWYETSIVQPNGRLATSRPLVSPSA